MLIAMQRSLLLLPIALFLTPPTGPRDELAWEPAEGTFVHRFETVSESELAEQTMLIDGEERENPQSDSMELTMTTVEILVFIDEVEEVDDERVTRFERTFEELSQKRTVESPMLPETQEGERKSDLESTTVVFEWDADTEEYEREFSVDEGLDDGLLEGLVEDLTLRDFLPEDEVSEGDSWEVDIETFAQALWPGGSLSFYEEEQGPDESYQELEGLLRGSLEGSAEATFEGLREEDGVRVAVITVEVEATTEGEIEVEDPRMGEVIRAVAIEREFEGELLWNLELQRLHAFIGESRGEEENEMRASFEAPDGEEHEFIQRMVYAGESKYTITLEEE